MDDNTAAPDDQPDPQQVPSWPPLPEATPMWTYGAPPVGGSPPLPVPAPADTSPDTRSWKIAVAVLVVLIVAGGGTLAGVLLSGSGDSAQARHQPATTSGPASSAATQPAAATADASSSSTPTPSVVTRSVYVTASPSEPADDQVQTYTGPGGISVQGPAGWVRDDTANLSNIRDYVPASSSCRLCGANIRIGIGNTHPKSTIESEARYSIGFLEQSLGGPVSSPSYVPFRGTTAADFEWSFRNDTYPDVERRGMERIWIENGVTMIVISSDLSSQWASAQRIFAQVTSSVRIS